MNCNQMEMLSVKSAIERTLNGLILSFSASCWTDQSACVRELFHEVERYVASLFVSRQIDQYHVLSSRRSIDIHFKTHGQLSCVNFMLPVSLWANSTEFQEPNSNPISSDQCKNKQSTPIVTDEETEISAYDHAMKIIE